jgi:hypothetical protein
MLDRTWEFLAAETMLVGSSSLPSKPGENRRAAVAAEACLL